MAAASRTSDDLQTAAHDTASTLDVAGLGYKPRTAETLEPVYVELLEQTGIASALNVDETGGYLNSETHTPRGAAAITQATRSTAWRPSGSRTEREGLARSIPTARSTRSKST